MNHHHPESLSDSQQDSAKRLSDGIPTIEQRIRDLLESAGLQNVEDVRAAADGYCVTFTGAGKYLITDALRAAVTDAGLKIVASNGKSLVVAAPRGVTEGFQDDYAHFAKGDKAIRKCDGVEFTVTDVRGDAISGVGTRTKTVKSKEGKSTQVNEPVYVELQHRKHFKREEEKEVITDGANAVSAPISDVMPESGKIIATSGVGMYEELDDLYPPDPLDLTPAERKQLDDDLAREIIKQIDAEYAGEVIDTPDLTPEERFNLTAYIDEPKPAGESKADAEMKLPPAGTGPVIDTEPSIASMKSQIQDLQDEIVRLKVDLERAREINRDLAESLADEKMINQARKELVEMLSQPEPTPKQVEAEQDDDCVPALYAKRINTGWKVACQQYDGPKLRVMWVREIKSPPPDDLADAVGAALKRVEAKTDDVFDLLPEKTQSYSLSEAR